MSEADPQARMIDKRLQTRGGDVEHMAWLEQFYRAKIREMGEEAALEIAEVVAHLHQERARDPLTGLYSLVYIESMVQQQAALMDDVGSKLAVLMIDLDHFKPVNDTFGHPAGNRALIVLARILRETVGPEGVAGRYGGEEFIVLVPYADEFRMEQVAVAIGQAAFTNLAEQANLPNKLTLSIGAVLAISGEPTNEIIARADRRLYQAKESGRNQLAMDHKVVSFGEV